MSTWRIAEALETLRKQLNEAFPKRSKASDGGIGDTAHASRSSDHNPWLEDAKGKGIVTARDFTHDPKTGIDCQWLADTLVKNKDPRIKYIIWNKQICSSTKGWEWRSYKGVNAHQHHLHLSVNPDPKYYDSTRQWKLDFPKEKADDVARVKPSATVPPPKTLEIEHPEVPTDAAAADITESKVTKEQGGTTVEVTAKNEQDVNDKVVQRGPVPYNGIGLKDTLINDAKPYLPANGIMQGVSDYAEKASGWPEWVVSLITKAALILLVVTAGWLLYRLIAWAAHTWRENQRVKLEATINTDVSRKNIEIVPHDALLTEKEAG